MRKTFSYTKSALLAVLVSTAVCFSSAAGSAKESDCEKLLTKGNAELAIGNKEKAQELFQKAVGKCPQSGAAHVALGISLKRQNKLDESKAEFKSATEVEPTYAEGWYEYGCAHENDKDYQPAADCFERYLELKPDASKRKTIEDRIRFCRGKQEQE